MNYEVIVIGCGPAGLSAAIYLGRAKVKTLLVGKSERSQLVKAHNIENYFGFPLGIPGKELLARGIRQAKKFGVTIVQREVVNADKTATGFTVKLGNGERHSAKILIIATGTPIKLSGIRNESELTGKGVHYCVECDGAFYKDKKVAVVGNGNHAAEDALDLCVFTKKVSIISNAEGFSFSPEMEEQLKKRNIRLIDARVIEFSGKKFLESVLLENNKKIAFNGVFMACGTASALDFAAKLGLEIQDNILVIDKNNMTNVEGIFAAGNCCGKCRQVAKNVGDGCNAAVNAIRYLRHRQFYVDYSRA
jgi:thioredoxin reductase (NADPH)